MLIVATLGCAPIAQSFVDGFIEGLTAPRAQAVITDINGDMVRVAMRVENQKVHERLLRARVNP